MLNKRQSRKEKEALEIIEEATHLLRLSPISSFVLYYAGTIPFIIGFLYFWSDMSRSPFAYQYSAKAALSMTFLFIWMKSCHVLFSTQIRTRIHKDSSADFSPATFFRLLVVQTAIQPTGFIILPLAFIFALPFGWVYAFYQNVSYFGNGESVDIKSVYKNSIQHAMFAPKQNHVLLLVISILGIFLFLNTGLLIIQLPHLLKMLFGAETAFTKAGHIMFFNTTYLAVTCSIVYLLLDPLIKTVYALRCFYGESLQSGNDLKIELKSSRSASKSLLMLLTCSTLICSSAFYSNVYASDSNNAGVRSSPVSPSELDRSISEVIVKNEYTWRMPRERPDIKEDKGLLETFIDGIIDTVISWLKPVKKWIKNIIEWLIEKFSNVEHRPAQTGKQWEKTVKMLLYIIMGLLVTLLILFIFKEWKRRRTSPLQEARDTMPLTPDINDENVSADELPANRWLDMARELMEQGNNRLALRAFYLACLAHLSCANLIKISNFKSNHEYESELTRTAHNLPELLSSFSGNIIIFEKIWYGMHEITADIQNDFNINQERIMAIAEK
jgi:hypothetical protein